MGPAKAAMESLLRYLVWELARRGITANWASPGVTEDSVFSTLPELGLAVRPDELVLAREMSCEWDFRHERVRVFELRLDAEPVLRIDNREIVAARFVDPQALLAEDILPPFIRAHLGERHPEDQRSPAGD
jgi:NAD(P)-dependent dehydrogenase (short-subunit alcohol dehydrogenase family)